MRKEPTIDNYVQILYQFVETAKLNSKKRYLQIQCFSCQGFNADEFLEVATNYYNLETKGYMMIPVSQITKNAMTGVPNAYCLVLFACCREVKKSQLDIQK